MADLEDLAEQRRGAKEQPEDLLAAVNHHETGQDRKAWATIKEIVERLGEEEETARNAGGFEPTRRKP